jgi:hypothetical protein
MKRAHEKKKLELTSVPLGKTVELLQCSCQVIPWAGAEPRERAWRPHFELFAAV